MKVFSSELQRQYKATKVDGDERFEKNKISNTFFARL